MIFGVEFGNRGTDRRTDTQTNSLTPYTGDLEVIKQITCIIFSIFSFAGHQITLNDVNYHNRLQLLDGNSDGQ